MESRTVDMTPTWEGILPAIVALLADGVKAEARGVAIAELERMAKLADLYVQLTQGGEA
jgi:hypothetical protein